MPAQPAAVEKRGWFNYGLLAVIAVLVIAIGGFAWAFNNYRQMKKELDVLKNPNVQQEQAKKENAELIAKLGRHMILPTDEEPVIATVTDAAALAKEQPFYQNTKNGDKVIVYTKAKKAIIYSPTDDKIVNVGPVYIDETKQAAAQDQKISVEVRNGTTVAGAANTLADQLRTNAAYQVEKVAAAANKNYEKTIIVDLSGGQKTVLVNALAQQFNAQVVTALPAGEAETKAEVLIIIGKQ